jgi:hypothetical protein
MTYDETVNAIKVLETEFNNKLIEIANQCDEAICVRPLSFGHGWWLNEMIEKHPLSIFVAPAKNQAHPKEHLYGKNSARWFQEQL